MIHFTKTTFPQKRTAKIPLSSRNNPTETTTKQQNSLLVLIHLNRGKNQFGDHKFFCLEKIHPLKGIKLTNGKAVFFCQEAASLNWELDKRVTNAF